jgi:hypothetical protein
MPKPETFNEQLQRSYAMQSGLWGPQNELEADIKTILRIHELTDPKNLPEFEKNVLLHVLYTEKTQVCNSFFEYIPI